MAPTSPTSLPEQGRSVRVGVQTPLQDTPIDDLMALWRHVDAHPAFDWISVWDHLGTLDGRPANFEAIAAQAALAVATFRVRVACLVHAVGYRHPLVLAGAIATIDHLSHGRAVLGLGAGYLEAEYRARGEAMPPPGARSAHLAETVTAMRRLFAGEEVTLHGDHVQLQAARCAPAPVQERLPIVIGGGGEQRTIPLAARVADGWNVPLSPAPDAARKVALLRDHEARAGRAPGSVEASLTVGLCFDTAQLPARYGARHEALRPAIAHGSTQQVIDTLAAYVEAGADRIVLSLRAPFDQSIRDDLDRVADDVLPALPALSDPRFCDAGSIKSGSSVITEPGFAADERGAS
jgi:alkanesulfonate monooxygenase SsuD/methylene tetrahydromethanopterin reductase-like flavin-dependent oxidoreductase (luciferase family)